MCTPSVKIFLPGGVCLITIYCFRKMGVQIYQNGSDVVIHGKCIDSLSEPESLLDVVNSGTTNRLMHGILPGRPVYSAVAGD
ncbi:3-phosphoshikimate 1-carboxyvinyltransferase, partial [Bacillus vallismortis]|nr:3-phosphoshikimate 1-carboxyvinyltransferase [Bacillus vallismortis]